MAPRRARPERPARASRGRRGSTSATGTSPGLISISQAARTQTSNPTGYASQADALAWPEPSVAVAHRAPQARRRGPRAPRSLLSVRPRAPGDARGWRRGRPACRCPRSQPCAPPSRSERARLSSVPPEYEESSARPRLRPMPASALIASLSYSTFQLKLEGMFAKAFQLQGLEPVRLVPPDSRAAATLLRDVRDPPLRHARRLRLSRARCKKLKREAAGCSRACDRAERPEDAHLPRRGRRARGALDRLALPARGRRRPRRPGRAGAAARAPAGRGRTTIAVGAAARRAPARVGRSSTSGTTPTRARSATSRSSAG